MKIETNRATLLSLIAPLLAVSPKTTTLPIIGFAKFTAEKDGTLSAEGTDTAAWVRNTAECTVIDPGHVCIHVHRLNELIRAVGADTPIRISKNDDQPFVTVSAGRARFKLNTMPASDFPAPPAPVESEGPLSVLTISEEALTAALSSVSYAMCKEPTREALNGMVFDLQGENSRVLCTDGHRLAVASLGANPSKPIKVMMSNESIAYLLAKLGKSTDEVTLEFSDRSFRIAHGKVLYQNRLKPTPQTDFDRVIPQGSPNLTANRQELIGALERSRIIANEKTSTVAMRLDRDKILLSAKSKEEDEDTASQVGAETAFDGMGISFNVHYIIEALHSITTENVTFFIKDSTSAALIKGDQEWSHTNVLMPVRS